MADAKSLRSLAFFKGMDDARLQGLAAALEFEEHADGHVFARAGRAGKREKDTLYIVLDGRVSVSTKPKSASQVPVERLMQPGEMFGLITFLKGGPRTATTRAAGPVRVASLTRERYEQAVRPDPALHSAFLFAIATQLARDVRACNERLVKAIKTTGS